MHPQHICTAEALDLSTIQSLPPIECQVNRLTHIYAAEVPLLVHRERKARLQRLGSLALRTTVDLWATEVVVVGLGPKNWLKKRARRGNRHGCRSTLARTAAELAARVAWEPTGPELSATWVSIRKDLLPFILVGADLHTFCIESPAHDLASLLP